MAKITIDSKGTTEIYIVNEERLVHLLGLIKSYSIKPKVYSSYAECGLASICLNLRVLCVTIMNKIHQI